MEPRQRGDLVVQAQEMSTATDHVAVRRPFGVLLEEGEEMASILQGGILGPLHLDGDQAVAARDDEVHLGSGLRPEVLERARAEVLQALPQLDTDPLLEDRARICADGCCLQWQLGGRVADAEVEEVAALCREETLARAPREPGNAKRDEHVLE